MVEIAIVGFAVSLVAVLEAEAVLPAVSVAETVKVTEPSASAETFFALKLNVPLAQVVDPEMDAGAVIAMVSPFAVHVPEKLYEVLFALLMTDMVEIATVGTTVSFAAVFDAEAVLPAASVAETVKVTVPSADAEMSLLEKLNAPLAQVVDPVTPAGAVIAIVSPLAVQVPEKLYEVLLVLLIADIELMAIVGTTTSFNAVLDPVPVLPTASTVETVKVTVPSLSAETFLLEKLNAFPEHVMVPPAMEAGAVIVTVCPFSEHVPENP